MSLSLILASTSPYKKELLQRLSIPFLSVAPAVDEKPFHQLTLSPEALALKLSEVKATEVFNRNPNALVIGTDQVIALNGKIFHKPETPDNAIFQLQLLKNKTHQLYTAVHLTNGVENKSFVEMAELTMKNLSDHQLKAYVAEDEPLFCAGSYKIESKGISLFSRVKTDDFNTIIGLPLIRLSLELERFGFKPFHC